MNYTPSALKNSPAAARHPAEDGSAVWLARPVPDASAGANTKTEAACHVK